MKKLIQIISIVGLVLISILIAVLLSEGILNLIDYNYTPLTIKVLNKNDQSNAFEDRNFIYDSDLIWRPKKSHSIFNSQGYRGRKLSEAKTPNEYRIFALGDSNTLGPTPIKEGVFTPTWVSYLEQIFIEQGNKSVTIVNAGVSGYSSFQGVRRLKEALSYQPDMVLISFGANDAHRVSFSDADFLNRKIRRMKLDKGLMKFKTGQLFLAFSDIIYSKRKGDLKPRVNLEEYKNNLNEIISLSKEKNITVVLLTRPFIGSSPNEIWWKNFAPAYNSATVEIAKANKVTLVDVYSFFKDKEGLFANESHFNKEGHQVAARFMYENIRNLIAIKPKPH